MEDDHSPYFNYVSWAQMAEISQAVVKDKKKNPLMFITKLLSIVYSVEEDILYKMKVSDIYRLRNAVEEGTYDDVKNAKEWLISYLKEKCKVDRFELMEFD
jgi:hypothetical protein